MAQWIERDFPRPSPEVLRAIAALPTSILSDCMNRHQAMEAGVRPLVPSWRFCGPAFTVQSVESNNWGAHQAIAMAKSGDVIVIAARGALQSAVWGHVMTAAAKRAGIAAVVIDGCVRDAAENSLDTLPIFCRGICAAGPHKGWPCNLNVPVSCAGVPVLPGDVVAGDADGVVVVPAARAQQVIDEAQGRLRTEQEWYRRIDGGETTVEILGLNGGKRTK